VTCGTFDRAQKQPDDRLLERDTGPERPRPPWPWPRPRPCKASWHWQASPPTAPNGLCSTHRPARPLRELRSRFDHGAYFWVKARKRVDDFSPGAELPRALRMPLAFRAGHQINLVARLLDVGSRSATDLATIFRPIPSLVSSLQPLASARGGRKR
jgi:hypothetical protein